jgi:hypothetical protein
MNKKLMILSLAIAILSTIAFAFFVSHPEINLCAPPYDPESGLISGTTVCTTRESPNWIGIGSSITGFVLGGILAAYASVIRKTRE